MPSHPFTHGELVLHHRHEQGAAITCGATHGCVTSVAADVACRDCRSALEAQAALQAEAEKAIR